MVEVITDPAFCGPTAEQSLPSSLPSPLHPLREGGPGHANETPSSLTPPWPWVMSLCLWMSRTWAGEELCGARGWGGPSCEP